LIFIAKTLLGYSEEEAWEMTMTKIITLYKQYKDNFDSELGLKFRGIRHNDLEKVEAEPRKTIISF